MHFYVDLSIYLWISMYLFVDRTAFVCGSLHTSARIYEIYEAWLNLEIRFFNLDRSLANQMHFKVLASD